MPLTKKGEKILKSLQREYGAAKGKQVLYAGIRSGKFEGAERKRPRHKAQPQNRKRARKKNAGPTGGQVFVKQTVDGDWYVYVDNVRVATRPTKAEAEVYKRQLLAERMAAFKRSQQKNPEGKTASQAAGVKRSSVRKDKKRAKKAGSPARRFARSKRGTLQGGEFRPPKVQRQFKAPTKRRHNPAMEAEAALYELFHGRPPERLIQHDELIEIRSSFAELGKLLELRFKLNGRTIPITEFGNCQVVATADGRNIYFLGGKQHIDLSTLEIDSDKDLIELGPCTYISYFSRKGFHDFEPVDYWHKFGEENGIQPMLAYDQLNRKLFLLGGDYKVEAAGIIN